jgi:hypothetical protein
MPRADAVPSAGTQLGWIERVVAAGVRRPGTAADRRVEDWIAATLRALGVEDVRMEPVTVPTWESGRATLTAWPAGRPADAVELAGFALPHTNAANGLEADLVAFDPTITASADAPAVPRDGVPDGGRPDGGNPDGGSPGGGRSSDAAPGGTALDSGGAAGVDVRGAIAVERIGFSELACADLLGLATAVHDPGGEFGSLTQLLPFAPRGPLVADPAIAAGAVGYVGVLAGLPWDTSDYYVPYDARHREISALWLDRRAGAVLDPLLPLPAAPGSAASGATMAGRSVAGRSVAGRSVAGRAVPGRAPARGLGLGRVRGRLDIEAIRGQGSSRNVVGTLPGRGADWVVIGTHHDAPWASAVEDGSGIALVLAQAAYWARVPADERPHNLMFLFTAGHMADAAGTAAFIAEHRGWLDERVVAEIHLEHAAVRAVPDGQGGLAATADPEVRWWFTSQEPRLERSVHAALVAEDLRRSMVLPPAAFMAHPPTDGGYFHLAGVPLVDFLTAPMYLFDSADTIDKVHAASLEPLTRAVVRIVGDLAGRTPAELRAAVPR